MRSVAANLALLALGLSSACGPEETALRGSLRSLVDLSYSRAVLDLDTESCALRFQRPRGAGEDTVLKLGITLTGGATLTGSGVDLAQRLPSNAQRVIVTRNVFDDPNKKLPELIRGTLKLAEDPRTSKRIHGELNMTFVEGYEFGTGTTVYGTFEAEVGAP